MITNESVEKENGTLLKEITPKALQCDKKTKFVWGLDHYEPIPGKEIGYNKNSYASFSAMIENGFTNVIIKTEPDKDNAILAGFDQDNIAAQITINENTHQFSYPEGDYNYYFLDEAFERYDFATYWYVRNIALDVLPSVLLLTSYQNSGDEISLYKLMMNYTPNTEMVCDQYYDQTLWCGNDQTDHWDFFKYWYGSNRVKSHWIHLYIDGEQENFPLLFKKANSLGIKKIWLYIGNKGEDFCGNNEQINQAIYDTYMLEFLGSAKWAGWLKQYDRLYRFEYSCPTAHPCITCDQNNISESGGWVLDKVIDTGYIEEWDESHWVETTQ